MKREPISRLPTHEVTNQPPPLESYNAFRTDLPLREAIERESPAWVAEFCDRLGARTGSLEAREWGFLANRHPPILQAFDRQGQRIDEVEYHPAYHRLMRMAIEHGCHSIAWKRPGEGGAVAHVAAIYLMTQPEQGFCCPVTMTHAAVPALRRQPEIADEWESKLLAPHYDGDCKPASQKPGVTFGMAMTEKQGGSDVRTNSTRADAVGRTGPGGEYELTGHKWFCSAPMSDAFLTLARTDAGLSCFVVPRWRPDGSRNPFYLQRLKDKLGNRSNASSELEYQQTWCRMVGEEGHGIRTILEMVQQTRLDAATAPAGMMRHALREVLQHTRHRFAFGKALIDQPLMRNVVADLALECEAATALVFRVARAFDQAHADADARAFARLTTAVAKYWINKRAPGFLYEAMECLGGGGYVEESVLPRLYREAPVNSIWEGSGNVICLDVLRAIQREPDSLEQLFAELRAAGTAGSPLRRATDELRQELSDSTELESRARRIVGRMARALQAATLIRHAPAPVADAFCATRLGADAEATYGCLPSGIDSDLLIRRAHPAG